MSHLLPPAIFLMGPTAAGKTDLALALARVLPCELISVDSALVYRGMDIGTAKPDKATLAEFPHRLVDIRDPAESYSAAEFRSDALAAMAEATARGRIPLLVGGTMLYYKALLEGLADMPGADPLLRADLRVVLTLKPFSTVDEVSSTTRIKIVQQRTPVIKAVAALLMLTVCSSAISR